MPKNSLSSMLKNQYNKGVQAGGVYWTMLMTLAIHNLYGWKGNAFDKIEREMERIDKEMKRDDVLLKSEMLVSYIGRIRGEDYINGTRRVLSEGVGVVDNRD